MQAPTESERPVPQSPAATKLVQPSSPRLFHSPSSAAGSPAAGAHRRIAIAVDLSDESAYAVKWAVQNYLRPGDAVILLHVRPTSVLYGADWGSIDLSVSAAAAAAGDGSEESQQKLEDDFDAFTTTKAQDLAQPLVDAQIPFKIHIVKDHDMKERLCLEIERLDPSAVIMGSRGFGAAMRANKGRLGSVSDYCVHHCVCPVVVVRYPDDKEGNPAPAAGAEAAQKEGVVELHEGPEEEEQEYHDASDEKKGEEHFLLFHDSNISEVHHCWWKLEGNDEFLKILTISSRGPQQGAPMSPLFFVVIGNILSRMYRIAEEQG